jgi:FAD:protein FMN transferase
MVGFKRMQPMLGTYIEIGSEDSSKETPLAIEAAFKTIKQLQQLLSFHEPTSDLTRLNQSNGKTLMVHPHTLRVIKLARAMTVASKGLFNCTVGGAMVLQKILPDHSGDDALYSGDANDIVIEGNTVQFKRTVKVTLDGIAKGYAVDCAIATLKHFGIKSAWVNAGGDLRVYGSKVLSICRREMNGEYITMGSMQNAAVATSIVRNQHDQHLPGKIVSDVAKPQIGAWTVMAHRAWRADALTKVACLVNENKRDQLVASLGGVVIYPNQ